MNAREPVNPRRRVGNVDILRAVAALCVLAVHAYSLGGRNAPIKAQHWYDVPLVNLSTGVWLFFAISGYVISKPFVDRLLSGTAPPATVAYALRRALRIFPLYWLALTVLIVIEGTVGTRPWQLVTHYLLLNNLVPGRQEALFPAAWTLSLEVLFYIAVPLFAALLSRRARRPLSAERLAGLATVSFLASALFTVIADLQGDGQIGLWLRGSLPAMWLMFCPGILLAIAPHLQSPAWRRWLVDFPATRWAAGVVLLTVVAGALLGADAPLRFGIVPYQLLVDASHPLFAIGYGLIVATALRARPWAGGSGWLITLGFVSYGIYLIHPVLEAFLLKTGISPAAHDSALGFVVNTAFLAGLTVPLALLSWRYLEQPAIELARGLGRRWGGRGSSTINLVPASKIRAEVGGKQIREFWNARAREDAFYFVDTRQRYRAPEPERFWQSAELVDYLFDGLGVKLRETDTVLEIGCGIGRITRDLAARAKQVIAVDVSDEMLARASALNPQLVHVRWLLGDGRSLTGVENQSVDACVSVVVLQHVPDPEITLDYVREVGRVLRPGGWAALQVSNDPDLHRPRDGIVLRGKALLGWAPKGQRHPAWLGSHVELAALRAAADDGEMTVEKVWGEGSQYCQVLLRRQEG